MTKLATCTERFGVEGPWHGELRDFKCKDQGFRVDLGFMTWVQAQRFWDDLQLAFGAI